MSKVAQTGSLGLFLAKNRFKHVLGRFEHVLGHFRPFQKIMIFDPQMAIYSPQKGSKYRFWSYPGHYDQSDPNWFPRFYLGQKID